MSRAAATAGTSRFAAAFWGGFFLLLVGLLQGQIPAPMDGDTAYHAAVAGLIRDHGVLHAFPWTPFSWLAHHYADKELLFHLLFIPVLGFGWMTAAQVVGTLCGAAILLTIYLLLRREGVAFPWLWALVPLVAAHTFAYRFLIVRPHLLSISLALVVLWAAYRNRLLLLGVAAALYPWCYVAWHLPLILVAIGEGTRVLCGQRLRWQPLAVALAGVAVGIAIHPNGFNLVRLFWIQIVDVLFRNAWGGKEGFDLGLEFLPETMAGWARGLLLCLLMTAVALFRGWRARKADGLALAFALTAVAFALMTALSSRFLEYFVPFAVTSLALALAPRRRLLLPAGIFFLAASYTLSLNHRFLLSFRDSPDCLPPAVTAFLPAKIPPGAQVFTPGWGETGALMLALPERRFIVGLDPTFFFRQDPALYRLWYRISHEGPADSAALIKTRFHARYVVCPYPVKILPLEMTPLMERLAADPGVTAYNLDDLWLLFELGGEETEATGGRK